MKAVLLYFLILFNLVGCASLTESFGTEIRAFHYGYGEMGEFFYLGKNDRGSDRFYQLGDKYLNSTLSGKDYSWRVEASPKEVLNSIGQPNQINEYTDSSGIKFEEWEYDYFILVFKQNKLENIKSTNRNKQKEYIWLDVQYTK